METGACWPEAALRHRQGGWHAHGFAGLWEGWGSPDGAVERTFAIVTAHASLDVAGLHDRMPVIVEPEDWPVWLGEVDGDPAALLHPPAEGTLRTWPVSRKVNRPANNGRELLDRVAPLEASMEAAT